MTGQLKPSVCIDAVLGELPPADALKVVSDAGFGAFEFWGWWDKELAAVEAARDQLGMQISACCTRFISLVDPATRADYLAGLKESIATAKRLNCPTLISQVGDFRPGVPRDQQHACLVAGLKAAAPMLEDAGITLELNP